MRKHGRIFGQQDMAFGAINKIESASEIIDSLEKEYKEALQNINRNVGKLSSVSVK